MTRKRGIKVAPLADAAYPGEIRGNDWYAIGVNQNTGETYLIHKQGVSYFVGHNKPWRFSDFNLAAPCYTLLQVRRFPTENPVDLADWIATFGSRLETNFFLAYDALTCTEPREADYNPDVYRVLNEILAKENSSDKQPA
jgi:hypothetical protein